MPTSATPGRQDMYDTHGTYHTLPAANGTTAAELDSFHGNNDSIVNTNGTAAAAAAYAAACSSTDEGK